MEKGFLAFVSLSLWVLVLWLGIISLLRVALRFSLSRYIVSSYQIYGFKIFGARSVWGTKDSRKGPCDIKAMVVIFSFN
jgi:hypothetical protein